MAIVKKNAKMLVILIAIVAFVLVIMTVLPLFRVSYKQVSTLPKTLQSISAAASGGTYVCPFCGINAWWSAGHLTRCAAIWNYDNPEGKCLRATPYLVENCDRCHGADGYTTVSCNGLTIVRTDHPCGALKRCKPNPTPHCEAAPD